MKQVFDHPPTSRNSGSLKALLPSTPHPCEDSELATITSARLGPLSQPPWAKPKNCIRTRDGFVDQASARKISPPGESVIMRKVRDQPRGCTGGPGLSAVSDP